MIYFSKGIANLFKALVLRKCYHSRHTYTLTATIIFFALMLIWLVLGVVIFTSDANDCARVSDTYGLYIFMLILLIIGFIGIFIGLLLLCLIPGIYMLFSNSESRPENRDKDGKLLVADP